MKNNIVVAMIVALSVWIIPMAFAAEHGGKEHGGKVHGGTTTSKPAEQSSIKAPSADKIRSAMKNYVIEQSKATGTFDINDPETGMARKLKLQRVHQRVGKTGNYYYSCADFKDTVSGEMLDLDLDVQDKDGVLSVADVRIHKVNKKERYTYDENDNRIPVHSPEEHKHEHGGK